MIAVPIDIPPVFFWVAIDPWPSVTSLGGLRHAGGRPIAPQEVHGHIGIAPLTKELNGASRPKIICGEPERRGHDLQVTWDPDQRTAALREIWQRQTFYLAKELGGRGIAVNTVAPGAIETDFGGGAVRDNPEVKAFEQASAVASIRIAGSNPVRIRSISHECARRPQEHDKPLRPNHRSEQSVRLPWRPVRQRVDVSVGLTLRARPWHKLDQNMVSC